MNRLAFLALAAAGLAGAARAEVITALTVNNGLVTFDSSTPGTVTSSVTINGVAGGFTLQGIDRRLADGQLYGFATNSGGMGQVYQISPTGSATFVAMLTSDGTTGYAGLTGSPTAFGVDFNPRADRLRITTNTGQNLRVNLANGFATVDGPLAYSTTTSDPNQGVTPSIVASAYTNNFNNGPATTTLYNFDTNTGYLVTQNPPNNGTLNSVALLSQTPSLDSAFDISGVTANAYAVLDGFTLSQVNLTNGTVTQVGAINAPFILDIAAPVPEPSTFVLCGAAAAGLTYVRRRRAAKATA